MREMRGMRETRGITNANTSLREAALRQGSVTTPTATLSTSAPCPMPHAPCPMPNAQCPMPHAPCPMPNAPCPMTNDK
ncbi:hypothetical protein [Nostoc sp.]|uniref:hypothetical protein n=1 Tax=Nostoc sp. TaxID=1180 RepID=UPI002FF7639F